MRHHAGSDPFVTYGFQTFNVGSRDDEPVAIESVPDPNQPIFVRVDDALRQTCQPANGLAGRLHTGGAAIATEPHTGAHQQVAGAADPNDHRTIRNRVRDPHRVHSIRSIKWTRLRTVPRARRVRMLLAVDRGLRGAVRPVAPVPTLTVTSRLAAGHIIHIDMI